MCQNSFSFGRQKETMERFKKTLINAFIILFFYNFIFEFYIFFIEESLEVMNEECMYMVIRFEKMEK